MIIRDKQQLGAAIRNARKKAGYNQTDLARKAGVRQATISTIENAQSNSDVSSIFKILAVLNLQFTITSRTNDDTSGASFEDMF